MPLKNAHAKYAIKSIFFMTQSKTPNTPKNPNYAKKSTKYSKILQIFIYAVLSRKKFLFQIHALFGVIYRPKKYGGVPKGTNIRYVSLSKVFNCRKNIRNSKNYSEFILVYIGFT